MLLCSTIAVTGPALGADNPRKAPTVVSNVSLIPVVGAAKEEPPPLDGTRRGQPANDEPGAPRLYRVGLPTSRD